MLATRQEARLAAVGSVAVVTGAGSGIGRAVALALLRHGYRVIVVGRTRAHLEETLASAKTDAAHARAVSADVSTRDAAQKVFSEAMDAFGRIDLLFNNAGVLGPRAPFEDVSCEAWEEVINVNLTGAFRMAQGAYRCMMKQVPQGGRIINNGSLSAHVPRPHSAPYVASKHAITGLTRALALEGRKFNIACGQIDIGNAVSPMAEDVVADALQADGSRITEPTFDVAEVAAAVVHMASLPLGANVPFMTIMATAMPFFGRG